MSFFLYQNHLQPVSTICISRKIYLILKITLTFKCLRTLKIQGSCLFAIGKQNPLLSYACVRSVFILSKQAQIEFFSCVYLSASHGTAYHSIAEQNLEKYPSQFIFNYLHIYLFWITELPQCTRCNFRRWKVESISVK